MTAPAGAHVLTDQGVPIGWSIIADRPEFGYLADPDASRPATPEELAALEEAAREEYRVALLPKPPSPLPHPPMCGCNAKAAETALDRALDAGREPQPEAGQPASIADVAADRLGITVPDQVADKAFAGFTAAFAADPEGEVDRAQPDSTAVIPAVEAITTTTPAITEEAQT